MPYVDGFVIAVPNANKEAFLEQARLIDPIFMENGALKVMECWGDDVPDGVVTSFPMAVQKKADETVVFSFIIWPDRATRDAGSAALMADPRMANFYPDNNPFDGKRMIFGGFETVFELGS